MALGRFNLAISWERSHLLPGLKDVVVPQLSTHQQLKMFVYLTLHWTWLELAWVRPGGFFVPQAPPPLFQPGQKTISFNHSSTYTYGLSFEIRIANFFQSLEGSRHYRPDKGRRKSTIQLMVVTFPSSFIAGEVFRSSQTFMPLQ